MAQHVQDSSVFERRLRPIYDNLEVGNNKKALQETEKLLKKRPTLICARALKGLALLRLGRYEESNAQLQLVSEDKPVDDSTLQVLSFCYKEMEQLDKICDLYNHAAKVSPGNEEILAHLFISYVRLDDYKAQQSVALQLFKAQPKNAYYFWAVMSVVLQGIRGSESKNPDKRKLYLALAERMVDKFIAEDRIEAEQEVLLYLNILEEQCKFEEALEFLNSPLCEKCYPGAPIYIKINLYKKLKMWKDMNLLLRDLLKDEPDRWDFYKDYLTSCFELHVLQENDTVSIFDECHDFLCQIIELNVKKPVRGPYLARLELHRRMREHKMNAQDLLGDFTEFIIEYFRLFGHKSCCTHDVTLFLPSISLENRLTLAGKLLLESGISSTTLPQNQEQMQKHICSLQISRICGTHVDMKTEHLLAFYTALRLHYEHGLSTFGKDLLPTDMGPSDDYALLAANVMYDISIREQKSHRLFEALCLLQYVLKNSPSNFHVKLLCLKIYHIFGCAIGAQQMYDSLDIKHILLDSMGYIHCNLLPLNGRLSLARSVFDSTLKFFTASYKERLEYIALTYRYCAFSKLQEFMDFKERLTNSLLYAAIAVEAQISDLVSLFGTFQQNLNTYNVMSIDPRDDRIQWNELSDNRDLSAIVRWDPIHMIDTKEMKSESFNQELDLLHIRSLMLRLVSSYIDLYHFTTNKPSSNNMNCPKVDKTTTTTKINNTEENEDSSSSTSKETDIVELIKDSWDKEFQRIRQINYQPISNKFLVNILPSKLHLMLQLPYEKFFSDLSVMIISFFTGHIKPEQCKIITDNVDTITNICSAAVNESNASDDGLWCRRNIQNRISAAIEILSLYAFILSMVFEKFSSSSQNPHAKQKSKKKDGKSSGQQQLQQQQQQAISIDATNLVSERERMQLIVELMRHLKQDLESCSNAISNWKSPQIPADLSNYMAGMSLNPEIESTLLGEVTNIFKDSHEQIVNEYKNLIKDKIRMIKK